MATGVSVLLGLGPPIAVLFLEQRTQAQEGVPSIWAEPGSLVPHGSAVTIVCRIPPGVTQLRLYHVETKLWRDRDPQGAPEVAQFSLQQVTHNQTGTYHCEYWTEGLPSGHSDPLELVVTGMYKEKPSLTAEPGPQVASGGQVALLCHTTYSYDVFTLCRDRAASLSQKCSHQTHSSFLMSPVTLAHGGTYRCYFSSRNRPHLWSLPSDPLDLLVTGPPSPLVVGVSAAAAVLLGLCLLLLGLCLCRHRGHRRARRRVTDGGTKSPVWDVSSSPASDVQREDEDDTEHREHGQVDTQAPAAEGPQEVTYVQLHPRTLTRSVGALLSRAPQDGSAQPCVYATLTSPLCPGPAAMSPSLTALFCLGLCLGRWVTAAQNGPLPKPSLRALPSSLVPLERSVTLWCQGPPGVDLYRLEKLGSKKYEDQNFLSISAMKTSHAGRYRCSYQNGSQWSLPSDHLELVATGVFDKPSLTAHPSPVVPPGGDVTLKCQSQYGFDQFALYKEGDAGLYKRLEERYLADFPMAPVTTAHSGTYRCYSFSNVSPYLWSSPSNPMVLTVTESPEASRRLITSPRNRASTTAMSRNVPVSPEGSGAPVDPAWLSGAAPPSEPWCGRVQEPDGVKACGARRLWAGGGWASSGSRRARVYGALSPWMQGVQWRLRVLDTFTCGY
nr:leukocyte immunoglobulin-like receptor subfamily B member 2 [Marmota flaviventris]